MKIRKEIKIGTIAVIALVLFVWGYNFLKGKSLFSSDYILHAHYQNSGGITSSDPVILNGFRIGQVDKIKFAPENDGSLIVTLLITNKFPIPKNSIAKIVSTSITGTKGIEIFLGDASEYLSDGDAIRAELDPSMIDAFAKELMPLKEKFEDLIEQLDVTAESVNAILNEQSQQHLRASIENLKDITYMVAHQKNNIDAVMNNIKLFSSDLERSGKKLDHVLDNVSTITDDLSKSDISGTINQLQYTVVTMDSILKQIQTGNGTIGQLISDDILYKELIQTTEQLRALLEDIQRNPKKYVKFSIF